MDSIKGLGPGKRSCTMPREVARGCRRAFRVQLKQPKRLLARDWKHAGFLFCDFSPATGSMPGFSSCGFERTLGCGRRSFSPRLASRRVSQAVHFEQRARAEAKAAVKTVSRPRRARSTRVQLIFILRRKTRKTCEARAASKIIRVTTIVIVAAKGLACKT